ncbi:succinylglutamate desuccinylase/aspartoacylase family protein [Pseudoduganella sp. UC29_106]|uniref:succinylglutamate desuccinylase/aspartoacylase family protein n=1 Tax=Pseudoduganella sp. UC29_106 TaxID=3374553 RepID=UPI00375808E4
MWRNGEPHSDTVTLKKALFQLAIDADVVLDLHCENEGALHLYAGTPLCNAVQPLADLMQASALLYTLGAGGEPFDEACSRLWWDLGCALRRTLSDSARLHRCDGGAAREVSVSHEMAERDADAILRYLAVQDILDLGAVALPPPACAATPLEGTQRVDAPHSGLLVYCRQVGERVAAGDLVAELVDPVSGELTPLRAGVDGVLFTRLAHRYVIRGMNVAKIAGAKAFRTGSLLSL